MSETPNYVLGAVRAFIDEDKREPLLLMFRNGIPLHTYPESRELIEKLLLSKAIRKRGEKLSDPAMQARNISIQIAVAQLDGAGLGVISKGENSKPTACSVVSDWYGVTPEGKKIITPEGVEKIWNKVKDSEWVESHKQFGRENSEQLLDGIQMIEKL